MVTEESKEKGNLNEEVKRQSFLMPIQPNESHSNLYSGTASDKAGASTASSLQKH